MYGHELLNGRICSPNAGPNFPIGRSDGRLHPLPSLSSPPPLPAARDLGSVSRSTYIAKPWSLRRFAFSSISHPDFSACVGADAPPVQPCVAERGCRYVRHLPSIP